MSNRLCTIGMNMRYKCLIYKSIRVGNSPSPSQGISMQRRYNRKGCTSCVYSLSVIYELGEVGKGTHHIDVSNFPRTKPVMNLSSPINLPRKEILRTSRAWNGRFFIAKIFTSSNATHRRILIIFDFDQTNTSPPCTLFTYLISQTRQRSSYQLLLFPIYLPVDYPTSKFISCAYICVGCVHHYCWAGFGLDGDPHSASMMRLSISPQLGWMILVRGTILWCSAVNNLFVPPMIDRHITGWFSSLHQADAMIVMFVCTINIYIGCLLNVETLHYLPVQQM